MEVKKVNKVYLVRATASELSMLVKALECLSYFNDSPLPGSVDGYYFEDVKRACEVLDV